MKCRIVVCLLLVCALFFSPALAISIEGSGWWECDYSGTYYTLPGSDLKIKLPSEWHVESDNNGNSYFCNADSSMQLRWSLSSENMFNLGHSIETDCYESMNIILGQDRDWFIYRGSENEFGAICPNGYGGSLILTFVLPASENAFSLARSMISSVCD